MNIVKKTLEKVDVLYDDKKWGKRIDPDEWNANFKTLENAHNKLVDSLTEQVNIVDEAFSNATIDGGNNIHVDYSGGDFTLQQTLDYIVSDINDRYTKLQSDAVLSENTNPLIRDISYSSQTGTFTITKKDGSIITIDTVIEKVPSSMVLKEETDGSVWLVITNQDGSQTKTNVTSLIEDTVINGSDTINVSSSTDSVNKVTTYTLSIKPNSIGLSHVDSELTTKFEETQNAKNLAVQAKDLAIQAKDAAVTAKNSAVEAKDAAVSAKSDAEKSLGLTLTYSSNAKGYAEQASSYKNSAEAAKIASEKARDEAQAIAGGDYATKAELNTHTNNTTLHFTADEKTKLSGIETNANNYIHPSSHPANIITEDSTHKFVTDDEKTKLAGIEANANKYVHPSSHSANIITQDATHRFVTDAEKAAWNESNTFIAIYGTTTNAEIEAAYQAGKTILLDVSDSNTIFGYFVSRNDAGTFHMFYSVTDGNVYAICSCNNDTWSVSGRPVLPNVSSTDAGKVLMVNDSGSWAAAVIKPTIATTTLLASSWDSTAKTYSFEATYPNTSYDIEVDIDGDRCTDKQLDAWITAKPLSSSNNKIVAKGDIPTVDIPVILTITPK